MKKKMTVGVAAVAARSRRERRADLGVPTEAVVFVADRRLTYADSGVTEAWVPKIRGLIGTGYKKRTTWSALFAGDTSVIDDIKTKLVADKKAKPLMKAHRPEMEPVIAAIRRAIRAVWQDAYDEHVYDPFGLDRTLVVRRSPRLAPLDERMSAKVLERGLAFVNGEPEFGCELAVGGFDRRRRSAVLSFDERGRLTRHFDTGCTAIGEGADAAVARLEGLGYKPWLDLGAVLYLAVNAKVSAERMGSVGPTTDAWVLLPHRDQPIPVPDALVEDLVAAARCDNARADFANVDPAPKEPRPTWRADLWEFVRRCYRGSKAASSIARARPSWLSQTDAMRSTSQRGSSRPSIRPASRARQQRGSSRGAPSPPARSRRQAR